MAFSEALAYFGSVRVIAAILGISVQAVYSWRRVARVPALRAYQLRECMGIEKAV